MEDGSAKVSCRRGGRVGRWDVEMKRPYSSGKGCVLWTREKDVEACKVVRSIVRGRREEVIRRERGGMERAVVSSQTT